MFKQLIATLAVLLAAFGFQAASATPEPTAAVAEPVAEALIVDINSAEAELLADLMRGVGPARARAIVEYRDAHGPFRSIEELAEVRGIGSKVIEWNRDRLRLR